MDRSEVPSIGGGVPAAVAFDARTSTDQSAEIAAERRQRYDADVPSGPQQQIAEEEALLAQRVDELTGAIAAAEGATQAYIDALSAKERLVLEAAADVAGDAVLRAQRRVDRQRAAVAVVTERYRTSRHAQEIAAADAALEAARAAYFRQYDVFHDLATKVQVVLVALGEAVHDEDLAALARARLADSRDPAPFQELPRGQSAESRVLDLQRQVVALAPSGHPEQIASLAADRARWGR